MSVANELEPDSNQSEINFPRLMLLVFLGGTLLRLLLFWNNHPQNAYDDHFTPIFMIVEQGRLPGKLECWECYQPPAFYLVSAFVARFLLFLGATIDQVLKWLQFLNCLYGILNLSVIYLILRRLPLSDFSRLLAFGTACFLPVHIYMGALHSNDTFSYLFASLSVYLILLSLQQERTLAFFLSLSLILCVGVFSKYTGLALLPVTFMAFASLLLPPRSRTVQSVLKPALVALLLPTLLLGAYLLENKREYGTALPFNTVLYDPAKHQPQDPGGLSLATFKPWLYVEKPILWPGQISSLWTVAYSNFWFDTMAKFLPSLKRENKRWWYHYYAWLRGEANEPPAYSDGVRRIRWSGSALITLGLIPTGFLLVGIGQFLSTFRATVRSRDWSAAEVFLIFALLLAFNLAGIFHLVVSTPVYSAMKASYLLVSMPTSAVFIGLGIMTWEKSRSFRLCLGSLFACLFLLVTYNTLGISLALE